MVQQIRKEIFEDFGVTPKLKADLEALGFQFYYPPA